MPDASHLPDLTATPEPGVYFGLDEDIYHRIPALSHSGIKNLLISPMDFWARCRWLNPDYEDEVPSDAKTLGKAYHARILEGREAFEGRFAAALDPADYPDALATADDLKAALEARGLKRSGNKDALIERLIEADPAVQVIDRLKAEHAEEHAGKTLLPFDTIRRIEIAAAMIERHPELCKAFTGGQPEVTVIWRDDEYGVPMKARIDYLKTRAIVDLKTFANQYGKPVDRAVHTAMAGGRYHIQAAVYTEAVDRAISLARGGFLHGEHDAEWIDKLIATPADERQFLFVFQAKGPAPLARGYVLPRNLTYDCGRIAAREAIRQYAECMERFGPDTPWIDTTPIQTFEDTDFPAYMVE